MAVLGITIYCAWQAIDQCRRTVYTTPEVRAAYPSSGHLAKCAKLETIETDNPFAALEKLRQLRYRVEPGLSTRGATTHSNPRPGRSRGGKDYPAIEAGMKLTV